MNEVLADRGYLSPGEDLVLELFGGGEHEARGVVARLKQSPGQVTGSFSKSGWQCWIPLPARHDEIEAVRRENGETRRVIHQEVIGGPRSPSGRTTLRLSLSETAYERNHTDAGS